MGIIQPEQKYVIHLLASVLHDIKPQDPPEHSDWEKLYKLSERHGVSNMLSDGINRLSGSLQPPHGVIMKFHNDCKKAVAREATQHIALEQLLKAFEENSIPCMPLKGCLIKYLYPRPDMRLMADVDILIKEEHAAQVKGLMLAQGFTVEHQGGNHDVYYRKPFMNVEIHRRLISGNSPYSGYLDKTWDRAVPNSGCQYIYRLSHEDFYIYLLIHLTKHYVNGGTGIRSFMDIWVYNKRYKAEMDWGYIEAELEKVALREFAQNICGLGETWFGNGERTGENRDLYEEMAAYIFSNGAYGTLKNAIIASVGTRADKEKLPPKYAYWRELFFPPAEILQASYPFLGRLPFLLPACWVWRGMKCMLFKRRNTLHMIGQVHSVSGDDIARVKDHHKRAGLLRQ